MPALLMGFSNVPNQQVAAYELTLVNFSSQLSKMTGTIVMLVQFSFPGCLKA
jgi:hypothetical protein